MTTRRSRLSVAEWSEPGRTDLFAAAVHLSPPVKRLVRPAGPWPGPGTGRPALSSRRPSAESGTATDRERSGRRRPARGRGSYRVAICCVGPLRPWSGPLRNLPPTDLRRTQSDGCRSRIQEPPDPDTALASVQATGSPPGGASGPATGTGRMRPRRSGAPSAATDDPTLRCGVPVRPRTPSAVEPCPGREGDSGRVYDPYLQRNQGIATDPFRFPRSAGGPCPAPTGRLGSADHDDEPRGPRELGHDEV